MNKEISDLLIFCGQSNMQGQTDCFPDDNFEIKNALEYRLITNSLISLKHPVGEDIEDKLLASHLGYGSMIPSFCESYIKETQVSVVAVHAAKGSTTVSDWFLGNCKFEKVVEKVLAARKKIVEKYEIRHIYMIWLQGESDAICGNSKKYYKESLLKLKNDYKNALGIEKFMIIRVGRFVNDERDFAIIKAQEEICIEEKDFVMLTRITGYLLKDKKYLHKTVAGHYNNLGQNAIGKTAGTNAGLYANGKTFVLEKEPYIEIN